MVFFLKWNELKNPQFKFSSQNLSIERNFLVFLKFSYGQI